MTKVKIRFFVFLCLLNCTIGYSATAVIGPSSGFVIGPAANDDSGLSLNNLTESYNLKTKDGADSAIQNKMYSLDLLDGKTSCMYDQNVTKEFNLKTGADRLDLIQTAVTLLDNPERAKPILNAEQSASVGMTTASETLGASQLTANESDSSIRSKTYIQKCDDLNNSLEGQSPKGLSDQNQLNYYSCTIYQIMSHLSGLYADSDTLYQKATELETIVNKAMEEQTTRNAGIQKQENKIKEVNKELTTALAKLKKAKADLKKATAELKTAQESLAAANKIPCSKKDDDSEDCSARDSAVATATAAVAKAQTAVDKAQKESDKATVELMVLLKTKMGHESATILALLSGTIYGDANGSDVHFKVNGKEFTLVDTDKALSSMLGLQGQEPHWGKFQLENPNGSQEDYQESIVKHNVDQWFSSAAQHLTESKDEDKKYYLPMGGEIDRDLAHSFTARPADSEKVTGDILDKFFSMGNGSDNIETIASALADYQGNETKKQLENLEAMKTPSARFRYNAAALDKTNELNRNVRAMIVNNICYLDSMLALFRKTQDSIGLGDEASSKQPQSDLKAIKDPLVKYLYNFSTARYKKKLEAGYKSDINVEVILREFEKSLGKDLRNKKMRK